MKSRIQLIIYMAFAAFVLLGSPGRAANTLTFDIRTAPAGTQYSFININGSAISWTINRPAKQNPKNLLCIPAAFTMKDGTICGAYVVDGKVCNLANIDKALGGALKIVDGKVSIFPTDKSKLLTKDFLQDIADKNGQLFQQFQVIENGSPAKFRDKTKFVRRGVGILKNSEVVIVESKKSITLTQFAEELAGLGVQNLIYTDMGAWSEGWVRNPKDGKIVTMSDDGGLTSRQTN